MPEPVNIATPSKAWAAMEALRELPRDLYSGTAAMRRAGEKWLPREPGEKSQDGIDPYAVRLKRSILSPFFRDAISRLAGTMFSEDLQFGEDVPEAIRGTKDGKDGFKEDIDLRGRNFSRFGKRVFVDMWREGRPAVLVDHTATTTIANPSAADDQKAGRPFLIYYPSRSVIWEAWDYEGGKKVLKEVRLKERVKEPDGVNSSDRLRVLRAGVNGGFATYEFLRQDEKKEWVVSTRYGERSGAFRPHREIPIHIFAFGRESDDDEDVIEPELQPLADLCLSHWQEYSDQARCVHRVKVALIHVAGMSKETWQKNGPQYLGPMNLILNPESSGSAAVVETSGAGAEVGYKSLERLEERIQAAADIPFFPERTTTLGETVIHTTKTESRLKDSAQAFKDGMERCLGFMAKTLPGEKTGGSILIPTDLTLTARSAEDLAAVQKAREGRGDAPDLSRKTFLAALAQAVKILPKDFTPEGEEELIQKEIEDESAYARDSALSGQLADLHGKLDKALRTKPDTQGDPPADPNLDPTQDPQKAA